jgi:cell division septal protein FtsQ
MNPHLIVLKKGHLRFLSERKTTRENFKLGVNSTYILTLLFIWFLWIYYVWTLNVNATKWYNVRTLEIQRNSLKVEKDLLDVKVAELESLSNLIKWEWLANMEKSTNSDFLVVKDDKNYVFKN